MNLTNVELHFIGFLSSAQNLLARAKSIINLAERNPDNARTLAACATILLTAALEQAVKTKLSEAAEISGFEEGIPPSETGPGRYLDIKVKSSTRIRSLPFVLTQGDLRLAPNHQITKILDDLIKIRNKLAHVDEPAIHLVGPDEVKLRRRRH